jgi:hypothetical protein
VEEAGKGAAFVAEVEIANENARPPGHPLLPTFFYPFRLAVSSTGIYPKACTANMKHHC